MNNFLSTLVQINIEGWFLLLGGVFMFVHNIYHKAKATAAKEHQRVHILGEKGTKIFNAVIALIAIILGILSFFE